MIYETEVELSEDKIKLLKQGRDEEVLDKYYRGSDDWEWIYIKDEKNKIGVLGKYAPEVCICYGIYDDEEE